MAQVVTDDQRRLAVEISTNLKYHLNQGMVNETTAALEALLGNSDVDLSLPMSMVAPPYRAQYLRSGEAAMRYLKVPASQARDRCFDGVFCFLTPHGATCGPGEKSWTLELVFVTKRQDRYSGYVSLLGETDRGSTTVGEWLSGFLLAFAGQSEDEFHQPMHAAVSYMVRVFLYMALAQARVVKHAECDEALHRVAGLGSRKRDSCARAAIKFQGAASIGRTPVTEHLRPRRTYSGQENLMSEMVHLWAHLRRLEQWSRDAAHDITEAIRHVDCVRESLIKSRPIAVDLIRKNLPEIDFSSVASFLIAALEEIAVFYCGGQGTGRPRSEGCDEGACRITQSRYGHWRRGQNRRFRRQEC
jgi:hypothetical protein